MFKVLARRFINYVSAATRAAFPRKDRRHGMIDRRQRSMTVPRDRREEIADRRGGAYAGA